MAKTATVKAKKSVSSNSNAVTKDRANRQTRDMQGRAPAMTPQPTEDLPGLEKIARLMSGLANRAAAAYADARVEEGHKFVRMANAGYHEATRVFEHIIKGQKVLTTTEQERLIVVMNGIKLLHIRVQDYNAASKDEAWRRENVPMWNPHPLGEDHQGFFAKEQY